VVDSVWVFDSFVATKLTNRSFYFFEKPLIEGFTEAALTMDANNYTINSTLLTLEMGINTGNPN